MTTKTADELAQARLKKLVKSRHPDHKKNMKEWEFLRKAIEGGDAYSEGNLFKHPKEDPAIYAERLRRASDNHFNISQLVLDTYKGYIFQTLPTKVEGLEPHFLKFLECADEEGRPAESLAKDILHWMATYGIIWVCIDKPLPPYDPHMLTAAQESEFGLEPYAYLVHPTHVLDGRIERGEPVWLLVQEDVRDDDSPWSSGKITTQYRLWEQEQWTLIKVMRDRYGKETYITETGKNDLGVIPFVPFRFDEGTGFACKGLLGDIAHIDRAIFNKTSLLDEIHYASTFPQLGIPFDGSLIDPSTGKLSAEGKMVLTMGLHTVIPFNYQAGPPQYISPSSGPADTLESNIQKMIQMALALALLDGEVAKDGHTKTASSGVSKAYVFEKLNRRLATIADVLEKGFQKVFRLVALLNGKEPPEPNTFIWTFPDNYEVRSLAQEIADTIALLGTGIPSDTFKRVLFKSIVRKAYPKMDKKILEEIDKEIEDFDFEAEALIMMNHQDHLHGLHGDPDPGQSDPADKEKPEDKGVGDRQVPNDNGNRVDKKGLKK